MLEFIEVCPHCEHEATYTLEDVSAHGIITCKACGKKHLACSICTCSVDQNANCKGCSYTKTKWALSIPDTEYVLDELIKSVDELTRKRIVNMYSAEDKAEKSIESCMEQIQDYVHEHVHPYIRLLCMESECIYLTVVTESPLPNLILKVCRSGSTDLCSWDKQLHLKIVSNWKSIKEDVHYTVQEEVRCILEDLKEREDKAKNAQYIADTFEI